MLQDMSFIGKNYIGGQWVEAASKDTFVSINPSHITRIIGKFARSEKVDIDYAVESAKNSLHTWQQKSRIQRSEYLDNFAQIIKANHEKLSILISDEAGKPINEARADVTEGLHMAQYIFGRSRMPYGDVIP